MMIDTRCSVPNIECRCTKMNLCSPSVIKNLCKELDIRPTKSKGQNFLIDGNILNKIVKVSDLKKSDTVLEVGPGLGCLTVELAKRAGKVISVELDRKLAAYLRGIMEEYGNVEMVEGDILKLPIADLRLPIEDDATDDDAASRRIQDTRYRIQDTGYKIVANLPYNITSRFLRKFLTAENKPSEMVLMIQKEVAQRICAKAGDMSLLAVSVQFYGEPKIIDYVSKNCFWPSPEVDSAVLRIKLWGDSMKHDVADDAFFRIVKIGFSSKRKQLANNLAAGLQREKDEMREILVECGLDKKVRAEDLDVSDWVEIVENIERSRNAKLLNC